MGPVIDFPKKYIVGIPITTLGAENFNILREQPHKHKLALIFQIKLVLFKLRATVGVVRD